MSRTLNTDPYPIQARRAGIAHHVCDRPDVDRCSIDDPYSPTAGRYRCAHRTDRWGGHRSGQSGWATLRERTVRASARAQLRVAVSVANAALAAGTDDALWDIDVVVSRRSVCWDLW